MEGFALNSTSVTRTRSPVKPVSGLATEVAPALAPLDVAHLLLRDAKALSDFLLRQHASPEQQQDLLRFCSANGETARTLALSSELFNGQKAIAAFAVQAFPPPITVFITVINANDTGSMAAARAVHPLASGCVNAASAMTGNSLEKMALHCSAIVRCSSCVSGIVRSSM